MGSAAAHMLGNETDRVALLAFKNQISPNSEQVLSSWNTSSHFCEWGGVTCSRRHGRVIELKLDFHGLAGSISPYIGNLSFLRNLNLSNNLLNGQIPQEVGRLSRLQSLVMTNNSLSGALPVNLSRCSKLQLLDIGKNNLTGRIPEAYGSFGMLTEFNLPDNSLKGGIPASLGNLSSMDYFELGFNNLTGSIPGSLSQLRKLETFSVGANLLSGTVPPSFFNISSLQIISLTSNHLEGSLPRDIGSKFPNLRILYIGGNQFSGSIPISLFTNTSQLSALGLSANKFSGAIPVEIGKQKNLAQLTFDYNSLGSGGEVDDLHFLTSLNNCTNLQYFTGYKNNFGGKLPLSLTNLSSQLTWMYLGGNKIFGSIPHDIGKLQNLIGFSLQSNALTGVIPTSIGKLQKLQDFALNGNYLRGEIPQSIGNMSSLYRLDLSRNMLEGTVFTNLGNLQLLSNLFLGYNHLTGTIPKQLFTSCRQLLIFDLSHNHLVGPLPSEVGNLESLVRFSVSSNRISGPIPNTLGSCSALQGIYLHDNFFWGEIPSFMKNLKSIVYISMSKNNLSGKISKDFVNLPYLKWLNLSFNNLEGEVPSEGIFRNTSAFSIVGNDKLCGGVAELHLQRCPKQKPKKKKMPLIAKLTLGVILPLSFVIASLLMVFYSKKRSSPKFIPEEFGNKLPRISYKDLYNATYGFSSEVLIGVGSYGSVFKGVLYNTQSVVAVKVLDLMARGASKNFLAECKILRKVRHRNLLKLLTVCSSVDYKNNDFKALIYEFMSNGSLESWLHPTSNGQYPSKNLSFLQRLNIAIDIAFALDYLHNHFDMPIVHCDLKPSNVLLNQDMVACLGDFGLAKFLAKSIHNSGTVEDSITNSLRGTIGYIPPEYGMGVDVSIEGDVYSYGILILEMFTGKRPTDPLFNNNVSLRNFCEIKLSGQIMDILDTRILIAETHVESSIDDIEVQQLIPNVMFDCLISIMKIGVLCSSEAIIDRMEIKDVLMKMQAINEVFLKNTNDRDI